MNSNMITNKNVYKIEQSKLNFTFSSLEFIDTVLVTFVGKVFVTFFGTVFVEFVDALFVTLIF